jgi:hypothetical protein
MVEALTEINIMVMKADDRSLPTICVSKHNTGDRITNLYQSISPTISECSARWDDEFESQRNVIQGSLQENINCIWLCYLLITKNI